MSKLSAKYQFCAIDTADTKDGKVRRIRESPSFPKKSIVYTRPFTVQAIHSFSRTHSVSEHYILTMHLSA